MNCFDCGQPIVGQVAWLGERDRQGRPFEHPFHPNCADQPWPFYETREGDRIPTDYNWRAHFLGSGCE